MCLLAIFWRAHRDAPLVIGANREEAYARGGTAPQLIDEDVPFVAGLDPTAEGTWLGINRFGLIVAVTNRHIDLNVKSPRSRGLLVRSLLQSPNAEAARQAALAELDAGVYQGCNLFIGDRSDAVVIHHGEWLKVRVLPPGIHVLAAGDLNDETDPRVTYAHETMHRWPRRKVGDTEAKLKRLCGERGAMGRPAMCLRSEMGGTVSSAVIALCDSEEESEYWHAQGPPDVTEFRDYSSLLHRLNATASAD